MNRRDIGDLATSYGITRLCHFTPFRNLHHILPNEAIVSSATLRADYPTGFNPTDIVRLDRKTSHICTSIEYPNVWYLEKLEAEADVYPEHALLLIKSSVMFTPGTLFCPNNAARSGTSQIPGADGLSALYADVVVGKATYRRKLRHPRWLPTDMQAEVLIPNMIPLEAVTGIVVRSQGSAAALLGQLRSGKTGLKMPLYVSAEIFDKNFMFNLRAGGPRPREELYME